MVLSFKSLELSNSSAACNSELSGTPICILWFSSDLSARYSHKSTGRHAQFQLLVVWKVFPERLVTVEVIRNPEDVPVLRVSNCTAGAYLQGCDCRLNVVDEPLDPNENIG